MNTAIEESQQRAGGVLDQLLILWEEQQQTNLKYIWFNEEKHVKHPLLFLTLLTT